MDLSVISLRNFLKNQFKIRFNFKLESLLRFFYSCRSFWILIRNRRNTGRTILFFQIVCHSRKSGNPDIYGKLLKESFYSRGQVIIEAVLSLLVLLSFLYLLQKLYEESDESIQKARLSSQSYFKEQGERFLQRV